VENRSRAPREPQRSLRLALVVLGFSILVAVAIVLSAIFPSLRFLTLGYEVSPLAGLYFAACGFAILLVARQAAKSG
jgi:hypothetical protein